MTDTTDIKKQISNANYRGDHYICAKVTDIELIIQQLEAERQRAERGEAAAGIIQQAYSLLERSLRHTEETLVASNDLLMAAEKEITALKTDIESYICINGELATEVEELRAKLANPVVLPPRLLPTPSILTFSDAEKAITEAGFSFTVKGE